MTQDVSSQWSEHSVMLTFLAGFPAYFMISAGAGADPLSSAFCAWLGFCVARGVVRSAPPQESAIVPPPLNKTAYTVRQRFPLPCADC